MISGDDEVYEDRNELKSLNTGDLDRFQQLSRFDSPAGVMGGRERSGQDDDSEPLNEDDDDDEDFDIEARFVVNQFAEGPPGVPTACPCCDTVFCFLCHRVGNFRILLETPSAAGRKLWCMAGPFWPCMLCVTLPFLITLTVVLGNVYKGKHPAILIVWYIVCVFCMVCLLCTSFSNPGIVARWPKRPHRDWAWTRQTNSFRPRKSVYCRDCNCVVEEYDHVCPWTGTAIGKRNMCFFQSFVTSCALMFVFALIMVVAGSAFAAQGQ